MEDSEAISQGVDDFLEGTRGFKWAKNWLHREGGFRFGVRVMGTPLASGPHGYRFAEGIDAYACLQGLFAQRALGGKSSVPGTWVVKDAPSVQPWADGHRLAGGLSWRAGGWIWSLTR